MVRRMQPNGPLSNCVCVCERGDDGECFHPSGASTLEFSSYLLDVLLHEQQQVIEVVKSETRHLIQKIIIFKFF